MVKLASVSSMWTGSGSPSRASAAASPSSLSSSQASPVSVANRTERDNSSVVSGGAALNVAYLIGETKVLAVNPALARSTLDGCSGAVMELFTKLFGDLLVLVYHCFDRIVIHGYLSGLSRPEQVVYFFRQVLGVPVVSKEVLSQRTTAYQA